MTAAEPTPIRRTPTAPPELVVIAAAVATWFVELDAGRRPLSQLRPFLSPALHERLAARTRHPAGRSRRGPRAGVVRRVHVWHVSPGACEASVIVDEPDRVRALAMRLERHRDRWRVVELSRPEEGGPVRRTSSIASGRPRDAFDELDDQVPLEHPA